MVSVDLTDALEDRFDATILPVSRNSARAYVTVMEGCDLFCTFCVVPFTRGREISRPLTQILSEARALAERGVKELTLLGQTVNAYGRRRGQTPFHELLLAIDEIPGIERIRFTSSHPLYATEGLIDAYRRMKHLCPHLHLPVQSGSNRTLAGMRRRYTREAYLEIIARVRKARPEVAVTTDLLVGFPGESTEDFEETLSLMQEVRFSDAYAFAYSERNVTRAATYPDQVPQRERKERLARVLALQKEISLADNQSRIGGIEDVLVEGRSKTDAARLTGRTGHNKVVNFAGDPKLAGTITPVRIVDAFPNSLGGEPLH